MKSLDEDMLIARLCVDLLVHTSRSAGTACGLPKSVREI